MLKSIPLFCRACLHRLAGDQAGFSAVLTALAATVLMGFAGLAVDVGMWQSTRSKMQGAADQAAFSAAIAYERADGSNPTTTAQGVTTQMGFNGGATNCTLNATTKITVCVNNPPSMGSNTGNHSGWEVIISGVQQMYFAGFFLSSAPTVSARSVAIPNPNSAVACILALGDVADAFQMKNNAQLPNSACGVASNSTHSSAISMLGSPPGGSHPVCTTSTSSGTCISAPVYTLGNWCLGGGSSASQACPSTGDGTYLQNGNNLEQQANPVVDPYSSVAPPAAGSLGSCASAPNHLNNNNSGDSPFSISNSGTVHFCHGLDVGDGNTLTLAAGTYYIDGGSFSIGNNATINGTGVTIIFTDTSTMNFGNGAALNIAAPISGTYSGIALASWQGSAGSPTQTFPNNTTANIQGAIYFPKETIDFQNNGTSSSVCTQMVGFEVYMSNNVMINDTCTGTGTTAITFAGGPVLAE